MSRTIVQLGYGRMGKLVLRDLLASAQFDELVIADARRDFIEEMGIIKDPRLIPTQFDVTDYEGLVSILKDADIVVELLPVKYTMDVAKAAVETNTNMVSSVFIIDWSIQEPEAAQKQQEEMAEIDKTAREKGLTNVGLSGPARSR